ncbi:MAG: methylenetetrahydrofolate--tRNA-(uracil(54)-C(5))-methyltransferase (FADH(2)-oxidizing) TrmFO [Acholeplasmatales bacterium]|nr:MAG: methylenetetrahydrofolate--tRNA-(uracil(54)-C(5))-methyltransferase (FADH(2)-oxidizing) TrmFO [Acholeplasmatales bacterium]
MKHTVTVVGAGLAGSEATYQLIKRGIPVRLIEMRPIVMTPAHHSEDFAELVCTNSLRGDTLKQAVGVLKEEMRLFDSLILQAADAHRVPAGGALAVDREGFSKTITDTLKNHPLVTFVQEELTTIPKTPWLLATGPLTSPALMQALQSIMPEDALYFYDAAAPIVEADSINLDICYRKSRYDKGSADYLNCPMDEATYKAFYAALIDAECAPIKDFELKVFEGCMPVEEMARRGEKTLLFGPLKPVGLLQEGKPRPHAVVQLRQDDARGRLYNLVGFQTHLTFPEQRRIIRMIPGLEQARIVRYGVMHRNSFVNAPTLLDATYRLKAGEDRYLAGQLTGVEGYVESAASGLVAGISLARSLQGKPHMPFPKETVMGAMADYIAHADPHHFQPMNANFGLLPDLAMSHKKQDRKSLMAERALEAMRRFRGDIDEP